MADNHDTLFSLVNSGLGNPVAQWLKIALTEPKYCIFDCLDVCSFYIVVKLG